MKVKSKKFYVDFWLGFEYIICRLVFIIIKVLILC